MRIAGQRKHSFVDGPGIRYVVFFQGCPHNCYGCHNPDTHAINGGTEIPVEDVISDILNTKHIDGVTLSGGDPFLQPEACIAIADAAHERGYNVWAYSGWTYEAILKDPEKSKVLHHIDVLVDGPFILAEKADQKYRGSANQRVIDCTNSLLNGVVTHYKEDNLS